MAIPNHEPSVLQETLDVLGQATGGLLQARLGAPDEPGWVTGADVVRNSDVFVPDLLERLASSLGGNSRKVVASFFLKDWLR
jgi:hypothetical protein